MNILSQIDKNNNYQEEEVRLLTDFKKETSRLNELEDSDDYDNSKQKKLLII